MPAIDVLKVRFNDRMQQWMSWITQEAFLLRPAEKRPAGYVTRYFDRLQSALLHQTRSRKTKKKITLLVAAIQQQQYNNDQFADNFTEKLRLVLSAKAGQLLSDSLIPASGPERSHSPADILATASQQGGIYEDNSYDAASQLADIIVASVTDEIQKSTLELLNMNKAAQALISPEYTGHPDRIPGREIRYRMSHAKAIAQTSDYRLFYSEGPSLSCEQQQALLQSLRQAMHEIEQHSALHFSPASSDQNTDIIIDVFSDSYGYHIDFTGYFYRNYYRENRYEERVSLSECILTDRVHLSDVFIRKILFYLGVNDPPEATHFPWHTITLGTASHPTKLEPVDKLALQKLHGRPRDITGLSASSQPEISQRDSQREQARKAPHLLVESIASSMSQKTCASPVHLPSLPVVDCIFKTVSEKNTS